MNLVAYFTTPAQALVGRTTQIPSSRVLGRMTTGLPTTFTAITQNAVGGVGTAGGSLALRGRHHRHQQEDQRTDNLDLQLNLVGFPTLAPGLYTGRSTCGGAVSARRWRQLHPSEGDSDPTDP